MSIARSRMQMKPTAFENVALKQINQQMALERRFNMGFEIKEERKTNLNVRIFIIHYPSNLAYSNSFLNISKSIVPTMDTLQMVRC
jgi:hypothetical protein